METIPYENTTLLEQENNKQKLQILEALHIRKKLPKLKRINFESSTGVQKFYFSKSFAIPYSTNVSFLLPNFSSILSYDVERTIQDIYEIIMGIFALEQMTKRHQKQNTAVRELLLTDAAVDHTQLIPQHISLQKLQYA